VLRNVFSHTAMIITLGHIEVFNCVFVRCVLSNIALIIVQGHILKFILCRVALYREREFHVLKLSLSVALFSKRYSDNSHVNSHVYIFVFL